MALKVTLGEVEVSKEEYYPRLMVHKDTELIVLMVKDVDGKGCGYVLTPINGYSMWKYSECWLTVSFRDYNKPIVIQNE